MTRIGITLGDPKGIGPEVVRKAIAALAEKAAIRFVLFGEETSRSSDQEAGCAAGKAIEAAVRAATRGEIDAIVTAPIHKGRLNLGGYRYPGHTEFLAALTGSPSPVMMFVAKNLKVSLMTIHESLSDVPRLLTRNKIVAVVRETARGLQQWFGIPAPRIAVAGLNPHAGEGGLFGREEQEIIAPAVAELKSEIPGVSGPYPPDTLFYRAHANQFDAVIAMYHDQGLIPVKLLDFHGAVNVTLGLPLIRTSPDHGTADDIAGQGIANPTSMIAAIRLAEQMVLPRRQSS